MRSDDTVEIAELEKECFSMPWSHQAFVDELSNSVAHYLVCEAEGKIAAYGGMWIIFDEAHITNIAVSPSFRRRHIGKKLLLHMFEHAVKLDVKMMTLEVRESNIAAQKLYSSLGFKLAGIRKHYYSDTDESALILWNEDIALTLGLLDVSIKII